MILNASDPYLPAFIELDRAMRQTIRDRRGAQVEFHAETLDLFRFSAGHIENQLVSLLGRKYDALTVDVVAVAGEPALAFALDHGDTIWPGAAIVFHSVRVDLLRDRVSRRDIAGVPVRFEIDATIDLALALAPATRRVALVAGTAELDQRYLAAARTALAGRKSRLETLEIVGGSLASTIDAVSRLPRDSVVLFLTVFRNEAGERFVPREFLQQLAAVSPVPMFGLFETYVGAGVVGGMITSYAAQGRRAGELVASILDGRRADAIGIQAPIPPGCMVDSTRLRHWGLRESRLPPGCDVRFREPTLWERHRDLILATLAVLVAQSALIVLLVLGRRRLRGAQSALRDELDRRRQAEGVALGLRARLARFARERSMGALATAIAHEVNQPLVAIQNYAQAARRRLKGSDDNKPKVLDLLAKVEGQAERAGAITQRVRRLMNAEEMPLASIPVRPAIDTAVDLMRPEADALGCRIDVIAGSPITVLADPLQVQLVMVNLLRNAMQAVAGAQADDRTITVEILAIDDQHAQVRVTDRGPGVAPGREHDIFEPLFSGGSGMGMGLAIARSIVEAQGGKLWHEPVPAGGARFLFTIRRATV
ncbi:MAG: sensor histidine kinase [Burkholderiales bacterium]|nr:sensor histidine kinase [Burkholderiales bacterium]